MGWRHRIHTNHCLGRANPPTQTLHIQPVGWLLNTLLFPLLLYANTPYTTCSLYFHIHKRQPSNTNSSHSTGELAFKHPLISSAPLRQHTLHSLLSLFPYPQTPTHPPNHGLWTDGICTRCAFVPNCVGCVGVRKHRNQEGV